MQTRLEKLCDAIMEAAWLAALIVVPIYFNVYSQRVFEPDKIGLLRSLALVALVAWIVKRAGGLRLGAEREAGDEPAQTETAFWRKPLVIPVLALAGVYLLSTLLSVNPRPSFWGSYQRLQGTFSMYSYMILFFVAIDTLRSREQWQRLQYTVILASVPVALYGIFQRSGIELDPLPWGGDTSQRVAGNMGNAIFLAAYLILTVPLTIERLISAGQKMLLDEKGSTADALTAGVLLFVLLIQLAAIVFTQSRGPWLGLAAGGYLFLLLGLTSLRQQAAERGGLRLSEIGLGVGMGALGLAAVGGGLMALIKLSGIAGGLAVLAGLLVALALYLVPLFSRGGWRWLWLSVITQGVLAAVFLILINLPNTTLNTTFKQAPYVGRLAQIMEVESGTGRVRSLIWQGVINMFESNESLQYPDGSTDKPAALRKLIGYGPESMWVSYNHFYLPELGGLERRNASPDRSHNETFDSLVITGVLGFLTYFFVFSSLFFYALRWLGLIVSRSDRIIFIILGVFGAALGILIPALMGSVHLAGVGLPFGFILGIIAYVTYAAARGTTSAGSLDRRQLLIVALLATIVAHFIEIHSGIAIAATRTYFFVLSAALIVIGIGQVQLDAPEKAAEETVAVVAGGKRRRRRRSRSPERVKSSGKRPLWRVLLPHTLIISIIFLALNYDFVSNQGSQTANTATSIFAKSWLNVSEHGILWMFLFTLIVGLVLALGENWRPRHRNNDVTAAASVYLGLSIFAWLIYGLVQSNRLRPLSAQLPLLARAEHVANHVNVFYIWLGLLLLATAAAIWLAGPRPDRTWGRQPLLAGLLGGILGAAALFVITTVNISLVRADVFFKVGQNSDANRDWQSSLVFYDEATRIMPKEDHYQLFRGRALLESARTTAEPLQQTALLDRAEEVLYTARALNPLNTDHSSNLARYYATRAGTLSGEERTAALAKAAEEYGIATTLSPHAAHLQNEWGTVYVQMGEYDLARERFAHSLELDPNYNDTYVRMAQLESLQENWEAALDAYTRAAELSPGDARAHSGRGFVLARLGRTDEAIAANLEVLALSPNNANTLQNLAVLYRDAGDYEQALVYAQRVRELLSGDQQAAIDALIQQLQQQLGG